jgi:hypothetical protein
MDPVDAVAVHNLVMYVSESRSQHFHLKFLITARVPPLIISGASYTLRVTREAGGGSHPRAMADRLTPMI